MKVLAERGVDIFFTQVFRHNFFHADMHPGNVFVDVTKPHDPKYISVDFGIVGSLSVQDQRYLAENLHAFFNRDYKKVAEVHIESGWVPSGTSVVEFEAAIRTVCEPIFQLTFKDISYGKLVALNEAILQMAQLGQQKTQSDMEETKQLVETVKRTKTPVDFSLLALVISIYKMKLRQVCFQENLCSFPS